MAKIAYIGSFKNLWDEEGNAQAFEKLGHQVFRFQEGDIDPSEIIREIDEINPDLVIYAKLKFPIKRDFLVAVLRRKYKTAYWSFDLYLGYYRSFLVDKDPLFKSRYVFTPDGGHDAEWRRRGVNHYCVRQGICEKYCYQGKKEKRFAYDVVFVGSENYYWAMRSKLCHFLQENYHFHWFGRNNTLEVRGDKLNNLCASAKIIVGDSVYSPYYWSNRIYEMLGRGAFLMQMNVPGLDKEYQPYEHFIPFNLGDYKGLKEKIDYFLARPAERAKIAQAAQKYTLKNHTLVNRAKQIMEIVNGEN